MADRSPCDYAAFWMHYGALRDRDRTERTIDRFLAALDSYDRIVVLPWGAIPLESDGVRSTDRWLQFRFQAIVEALHQRFTHADRLLRVPVDMDGLDARVEWVMARI